MKKYLPLMIILLCTAFVFSCGGVWEPASVGVCFEIYSGESYSSETYLIGINSTLHNDKISPNILETTKSMLVGDVGFYLVEGAYKSDTYSGLDIIEEQFLWQEGKSDFYVIINNPVAEDYNNRYETKQFSIVDLQDMPQICLNKISE